MKMKLLYVIAGLLLLLGIGLVCYSIYDSGQGFTTDPTVKM